MLTSKSRSHIKEFRSLFFRKKSENVAFDFMALMKGVQDFFGQFIFPHYH